VANRLEVFRVTAAAAAQAVPLLNLGQAHKLVNSVAIDFPDGCAGFVSAQLLYAGGLVIPQAGQDPPKGNEQTFPFAMNYELDGNAWQAVVVNSDPQYAHTVTFTFDVDDLIPESTLPLPSILLLPVGS